MAKILIVEDEESLRDVYKEEFSNEGFEVEVASDGEEGLKKMFELRPDIVLMDILMPKMSGFDMLKGVREKDELKNIPIIVLTNLYTDKEDMVKNWGVAFVLLKVDYNPGQLVAKVKEVLLPDHKLS